MNPSETVFAAKAKDITQREYLRHRIEPHQGDPHYLPLSDLRLALDGVAGAATGRVLDYGCGASPYRELFPGVEYRRADFLETGDLDYTIDAMGRVPAPDGGFDLVLSTQVAEHLPDASVHWQEAHRLLRPGGRFILSTHGTFPDHGCPYDFRRWTADGLKRDIEKAGFRVDSVAKLTTNLRAVAFLLSEHAGEAIFARSSFGGWLARQLCGWIRRHPAAWHLLCDTALKRQRVLPCPADGHTLYLGLFVVATRP